MERQVEQLTRYLEEDRARVDVQRRRL